MSKEQLLVKLDKAPSKQDAIDCLLDFAEQNNCQDFAPVYQYLNKLPNVSKKDPFYRVARACGVRDIRFYLSCVFADHKYIVATDGHRMHRYLTHGYKPGFHDRKTAEHLNCVDKFPVHEKVFARTKGDVHKCHLYDLVVQQFCNGTNFVALPCGSRVNVKYLTEALNGKREFEYFKFGDDAIYIKDGLFEAVIMCLRV